MTKLQEIIDDRYLLIRPLGFGGMGEVYLAWDQLLDDMPIAIKLLSEQVSRNPKQVQRFKQEVALARQLQHSNIVQVFDTGKSSLGRYYITMEYVEGTSLREKLEQGPLTINDALEILFYISLGLSAAHEQSIIHRDIKPDNVLISKEGIVKVVDFGVAKSVVDDKGLTETGEIVGTSYYMAPEQFTSGEHDNRVDIYSLGILAFELLTGERPFIADSYVALYTLHLTEQLPNIADFRNDIPVKIQEFVERCTAKVPDHRFSKTNLICSYLADELKECGVELPAKTLAEIATVNDSRGMKEAIYLLNEKWKRLGTLLRAAVIAILPFILVVILSIKSVGILERLNLGIMDSWFFLRGRKTVEHNLLIAKITEKSFTKFSLNVREPWPRIKLAELIESLAKANAQTVVLDFLLSGQDLPDSDKRLAASMQLIPTYIGKAVGDRGFILPEDIFSINAKGIFSMGVREIKGVVRQFGFSGSTREIYPSVSRIAFSGDFKKQELPKPTDFINYYGAKGAIPSVSVEELLEMTPKQLEKVVKGATVFVGTVKTVTGGASEPDTFLTAMPGRMPGVEIHATSVSNLLEHNWIRSIWADGEAEVVVSLFVLWAIFAMSLKVAFIFATGIMLAAVIMQMALLSSGFYLPLGGVSLTSAVGLALHATLITKRARKLEHRMRGG